MYQNDLLQRYPQLKACEASIYMALDCLAGCFRKGGKLIAMGNGGSSADAEHLCAELNKGNILQRLLHEEEKNLFPDPNDLLPKMLQGGLPAMSLGVAHSFLSAFVNDVHPEYIFAQQIWVHGKPEDVVLAISTSGKSKNVVHGLRTAKVKGMKTIALTGEKASACSEIADITIMVPETEVHKVQELHLPVYHFLCHELEQLFFNSDKGIHYQKFR